MQTITLLFILFILLLITVYDVYVYFYFGNYATISSVVRELSKKYPIIIYLTICSFIYLSYHFFFE